LRKFMRSFFLKLKLRFSIWREIRRLERLYKNQFVSTATKNDLDRLAITLGLRRDSNESDAALRERLRETMQQSSRQIK